MSQQTNSLVGQVLAGTYQLERRLVTGAMSAVYSARHTRTGGTFAIKILHPEAVSNTEIYERFYDEARISSVLRHPNIVQIIDLNQTEDGTPFLVMELLEGEDLHDRLDRLGRLPLADALSLARQIGGALHAAHSQEVVHRDLKPQNIFLCRAQVDGQTTEVVKLLDFGLSKFRRPSARVTRDLLVLGTPKYMAPEAALGQNSQIDGRSDQFSLAVILYRALCGRPPFDSEDVAEVLRQVVYEDPRPLSALVPDLPPHVAEAIGRAMQKRKEDRFPDMTAFIQALEVEPEAARPPGRALHESPTSLFPIVQVPPAAVPAETPVPAQAAPAEPPPVKIIITDEAALDGEGPRLRLSRTVLAYLAGAAAAGVLLFSMAGGLRGRPAAAPAASLHAAPATAVAAPAAAVAAPATAVAAPAVSRAAAVSGAPRPAAPEPVQAHLDRAQAALPGSDCNVYYREVHAALRKDPRSQAARAALWHRCGAALIETSQATPGAGPGPGAGTRPAGYPPLRALQDGDAAPAAAAPAAAALLAEAEQAYDRGAFRKAIELSHAALGADMTRAYRVMGAAACALRNLPLASTAYQKLDPFSQPFVAQACAASP
jgi:serine/threonine-protein kinase